MSQILKIKKPDYIALSIINTLFVILVCISYSRWGLPIVDCFRNAYLAEHLSQGSILYKDIFHFYGPVAPYFNALLFHIFGIKLEVLYAAGIVSSFIIINSGYYLARQLLNPTRAGLVLLIFITMNVFRPGLFQYLFPYSFEALYGSFLLLILLLAVTAIIKSNNPNRSIFMFICPFILCLCFFTKQDVGISAFLTYYFMAFTFFITKKLSIKRLLITTILPLILIIVSFSFLLLFIPFNNLINGIFPTTIFSDYYLRHFSGFSISFPIILHTFQMLLFFVILFVTCTGSGYFIVKWGSKRINSSNLKYFLLFILFVVSLLSIIPDYLWEQINQILIYITDFFVNNTIFQWISGFNLVYLLIFASYCYKKKEPLSNQNYIIFLLLYASIFFLFRRFMTINLATVSNLFILPSIILLMYFLYNIPPYKLPHISSKYYSFGVHTFLSILIITNLLTTITYYSIIKYKITTERGTFTTVSQMGPQLVTAISLVKEFTSPNDTIFTPPEDLIINFMTGRKNATKYIQLLPGMLKTIEQEKDVIKELEKNDPKIIFISNNHNIIFYGKTQWGYDCFQLIFKWIQKGYTKVGVISLKNIDQSINTDQYLLNIFINKKNLQH